jgi:hypothetical protein
MSLISVEEAAIIFDAKVERLNLKGRFRPVDDSAMHIGHDTGTSDFGLGCRVTCVESSVARFVSD